MISFEIRVNGSLICAINCVNRGFQSRDADRGLMYEYEFGSTVFPYDLSGPPVVRHGTLHHIRSDGALVLARDLFARVIEDDQKAKPPPSDESFSDKAARAIEPALRVAGWTLPLGAIAAVVDAMNEWQPIETAPPGEYVLLRFEHLPYPVVGNHEFWSYKSGGFRATGWMRAPPP